jgi:hypothetical protein
MVENFPQQGYRAFFRDHSRWRSGQTLIGPLLQGFFFVTTDSGARDEARN